MLKSVIRSRDKPYADRGSTSVLLGPPAGKNDDVLCTQLVIEKPTKERTRPDQMFACDGCRVVTRVYACTVLYGVCVKSPTITT